MEAAGDDSMDMFGGWHDGAATIGRCGEVACNLHNMEKALRALQDMAHSACHNNERYSHMLDRWTSKLEKDAEMVCRGEKGRKYMYLLNRTFGVLQIIMTRPGASLSSTAELVTTLTSMFQRYKESYMAECWVPLKNTLHLNLDEFTADFLETCDNQRAWKVTAELRYKLREEIVDLIVPPYKVSLSALEENRSRLSGVLCSFQRVIEGKKKQKKCTGEELEKEIKTLFEG